MESIDTKLGNIRQRIKAAQARCGREMDEIGLIGICKDQPLDRIHQAIACGLTDFGHNYVQALGQLAEQLAEHFLPLHWHFVGKLQRNKVKSLLRIFTDRKMPLPLVHSLDRFSLAQEMDRVLKTLCPEDGPVMRLRCLLEVRAPEAMASEERAGCPFEEVPELLSRIMDLKRIAVEGLMLLPPFSENPEDSRRHFRFLRTLRTSLQSQLKNLDRKQIELKHLSMGMSHDFEIAIEEGATLLRLGTAIFGERQ